MLYLNYEASGMQMNNKSICSVSSIPSSISIISVIHLFKPSQVLNNLTSQIDTKILLPDCPQRAGIDLKSPQSRFLRHTVLAGDIDILNRKYLSLFQN